MAPSASRSSARLLAAGGALALTALAATGVALLVTGAAGATLLVDPGAATRWGLPLTRALSDISGCLTVGLLVTAAVVLPAGGGGTRRRRSDGRSAPIAGLTLRLVRLAGVTAGVWVAAGAVVLVLSYARLAGIGPATPGFTEQLGQFVTQLDLLRALLVSALVAAVVATGAMVATRQVTVGWLALLSLVALLPIAVTGHSAGSQSHGVAVDSLAGHLVGVTVWVGGLVALLVVRGEVGRLLPTVVRRYSTLAGWAFCFVAASGVVNALIRLDGLHHLATPYGRLVLAKVVALVMLGVAGAVHRRALIARLEVAATTTGALGRSLSAPFWRLVAGETALMGIATGVAVALASSAPPQGEAQQEGPAFALTGYPMPPPLHGSTWFTAWRPDLMWLTVGGLAVALYVAGTVRLARRQDRWPVLRTVAFVLGCLVMVYATSGAPGIYGRVLFSAHMMGHMSMQMVAPPLLVLGAPVTLALRTLPGRRDGSMGPREWLLSVVHSRWLHLVGHPIVAAVLFAGSLIAFYYSDLFGLALRTHTGHLVMHVHFLLVGYLFASVLIGVDPGLRQPPYPMRLLLLFATMAFHAFFGVALVEGSQLLAPDVLGVLDRPWGRSPLADQQLGGAVAWAIGELPTLLLGMGVALAWVRSDGRESRRHDRQADRDGDADLVAYNARLTQIAEHDQEVRR